jgi:GTPase SAR1 family protein
MDNISFDEKDLKLKLPFGMILAGPSSSGKTTFLLKFIAESMDLIEPKPASILYAFGEYSSIVPVLQKAGIAVYSGVPPEDVIKRQPKPLLLILDDLMLSIDQKYLNTLFTAKSHHQRFAILLAVQNVFEAKIRVARQNAQYLVLMRAPNSALAIRNIGTQLFGNKLQFFLDSYRQATERPYGWLLVDLHAASDPLLRLRTGLFKDDEEKVIFIPNSGL